MQSSTILVLISIILMNSVNCARILGIFPMPSRSHQIVFQSYTKELAKRGHELVVVSPDPFPPDTRPENLTDIDVSFSYQVMKNLFTANLLDLKQGVIMDIDAIIAGNLYEKFVYAYVDQMNHPPVQKLINDKNQRFDLIVVEGFLDYHLMFTEIFKAPVIMFPSFMGFAEQYEMLGGIGRHPILYPHLHRNKFDDLNLFEWAKELYYEYRMYAMFERLEHKQNELLKENFGANAPTVNELRENIDLLLLNSYADFANNRPVPPNIIYLGAVQLQPVKEIPKDLKDYLDSSTRGVIYVSFGSNIMPSRMFKELLGAILEAFGKLPYDILWKFDEDNLENVPKNVKYMKWFPQRDLLFHPNIKAFVTQCGLQSTDEAIDAAVPLVGIPMMAEQAYNAKKYKDFGIGVKLDPMTLTADDFVNGVNTVVEDISYKNNILRLKKIHQDQPQSPLERAVWWTEYVIRHSGARHMRSPAANMPWHKYYMLDILLPLLGLFITVLIVVATLLRFVCNIIGVFGGKEKFKQK
ncbi:UDP-glucuronosyltransferase 2B2-like [Ostrinia furnacalis]|uniref:UDP-glucuronosyltransferase 2B2-like n=1 Tax=Ostrinia furnacalis TaxID=93504 RepID=UPI00103CAFC2|nr:UDP-glucuronosyltransferase 2B2-like [Ostrinia furnacalis]